MLIEEHLHHQYGCRDEEHAWNRGDRRINILNDIVHPPAEIACGNSERQRKRQRRERCERTDHHRRSNTFDRFIKHVVANRIRTENVPVGPNQDKPDHQQPSDCKNKHGRSPWETPVSVPHHHQGLREGRVSPAGYRQSRENPREKGCNTARDCGNQRSLYQFKCPCTVPKEFPRIFERLEITYGMSVFKNRRLVEFAKRKRHGIAALIPCRFKALQYHNIQKGLHLRRVRLHGTCGV